MKIDLRRSAIKDLDQLDVTKRKSMLSHIQELSAFPNVSQIKRLSNYSPAYRLRVGSYRVLFDVSNDVIVIGRILHRKDAYR